MEDTVTVVRFSQIVEPAGPPVRQRRNPHAQLARRVAREYRFLTTWLLECERERVWEAIFDSEAWPTWWRGVERVVEIEPGDADGVGQLGRYTWRSKLPYELTFETRTTRVERPHLLEGDASGELAGHRDAGACSSRTASPRSSTSGTSRTTKWWMNLLAPIARPVFEWNHDWVMGNGGEGIASTSAAACWPRTDLSARHLDPCFLSRVSLYSWTALGTLPCRVPSPTAA